MHLEHDPWLAEVLGHDVYRVAWGTLSADVGAAAEAIHNALVARRDAAFYYAKVPSQAVDQVRMLCAAGFFVVDVNITFERTPDAKSEAQPYSGILDRDVRPARILVRDVRPGDHPAVLDIAEHCFSYSRFHLDPFFRREQANGIKREWIRSYILGRRGERLLVAECHGHPVGFLAVLAAEVKGCSCRVIDLIGVSDSHQGRGVGRELVERFRDLYTGKCDLLRVGTQVANVPSARLYERCGFRVVQSTYVLHAHVRDGKLLR